MPRPHSVAPAFAALAIPALAIAALAIATLGLQAPEVRAQSPTATGTRGAAAAFAGLCAGRAPSHARADCARIALRIAGAPDEAGRIATAVDALVLAPGASADGRALADADALAAAITALALDMDPEPHLAPLAAALGPEPDDGAVARAILSPDAVVDALAAGALGPAPAPPEGAPRDPHEGYALQPLLPAREPAPAGAGAGTNSGDPMAAQRALMLEEFRRLGIEPPPELTAGPSAPARPATRSCPSLAGLALAGSPLDHVETPLPAEILGEAGTLHAAIVVGDVVVPAPLLRGAATARIILPLHAGDWRGGGEALLAIYHERAMDEPGFACEPIPLSIGAAHVEPGAFVDAVEAMAALPARAGATAERLGDDPAPLLALMGDPAPEAEALLAAARGADPETRDLLDALAPAFASAPRALDEALRRLESAPAPRRREGRFERFGARVVPAQAVEGPARSVATPAEGRVCPQDAAELAAWSELQLRGEIAARPDAQNLLLGAQVLTGVSIGLAVAALTPAAAAGETAGAGGLATNAPGALAGLAFATYGIFVDYLDKALPHRADALLAEVDRAVFAEDDPDPVARLTSAVLVTRSKGWDPSKAVVDLLTSVAGFLGVEGRATGLARSRLEARYASQIGRLTTALTPGARENAAVTAAAAENLASSLLGWFGGDRLSGPLREAMPGLTVAPQICRVDILDREHVEVRLQQTLPDSFALSGGPPFEAAAQRWGEADLRVFAGPPLWRLRQADASIRLSTPRTQILLSLPAELQPGDPATLAADTHPLVETADFGWYFEGAGVLTARRNANGSELAITTSRSVRDFPIEGSVVLESPRLLPPRDPDDRVRRFAIGAKALGLRPEAICADPGESVRIFAFDGVTGAPVAARDLVFRTIGGGRVTGDGVLTDIPPGRDPIVVRARGVGANGYAGETRVARGCACGSSFFDERLVAPGGARVSGVETLALRGSWSWWTSGDYAVSGEARDTAIRLGAFDHRFLAANTAQTPATCAYQVAGLGAGRAPFMIHFSEEGPLFVWDDAPDGLTPTHAAIRAGGIDVVGEDLDGDGATNATAGRLSGDALFFEPRGPALVAVERLSRDRLVLSVSTPMVGRGSRIVGRRPSGQPITEEIERSIVYHARFETTP